MAKINGTEANKLLIEKIQEKIKAANIAATVVDNDEDKEIYKGKTYSKSEIETIKTLDAILNILSFDNQEIEEKDLLCYGEVNGTDTTKIYMEPSKQEQLFELINSNSAKLSGIKFPGIFGQYGEIPNTNGIIRPRPQSLLETTESYETYLEEYYKAHKIEKELDAEGIRKPYPHEFYIWSKGVAASPTDSNYRLHSYLDYVDEAKKKKTEKKPDPAPAPTETGKKATSKEDTNKKSEDSEKKKEKPELSESDRKEKAKERKEKRHTLKEAGAGLKIRLKEIKSFWVSKYENLKNDISTLKTGSKEEKWKVFKKLAVTAAIIVAGGILVSYVAGPLLSVLGPGVAHLGQGFAGIFTGQIATANGAIALSVVDRIVYGLMAAAAPAAAIYSVIRLAKLSKKEKTGKTEGENGGENGGENSGDNGGEGEGTGSGTGTDGIVIPEGEPEIKGNTFEEQIQFIQRELTTIGTLINEKLDEIKLLQASENPEDEKVKNEIAKLKSEINDLNTLRKKYIKAYNKVFDDAQIDIVETVSKGGATI